MAEIHGEDSEFEFHPEFKISWDDEADCNRELPVLEQPSKVDPSEFRRVPSQIELSDKEWRSVTASVFAVFPAYFTLQGIAGIVIR